MAISDRMMRECVLSEWAGTKTRCRWCNKTLSGRQKRWCSTACSEEANFNHWFSWSKVRAKRAGKHRCSICGSKPVEVDHIRPALGSHSKASCIHHTSNLQLLCKPHHKQKTAAQRRGGGGSLS